MLNCLYGENRCRAERKKNAEHWMMENFEASLESFAFAYVFVHGKIMLVGKELHWKMARELLILVLRLVSPIFSP